MFDLDATMKKAHRRNFAAMSVASFEFLSCEVEKLKRLGKITDPLSFPGEKPGSIVSAARAGDRR